MQGEAQTAGDVVAALRGQGIETVLLAGCDTHGILRGKRLPIDQAERALAHGMAMCDVFWVLHVDESDLVPRPDGHVGYFPTERAGYPDILARPDLRTVRVVPWHHRTALLLCDFETPDHAPVPIAPRQVLRTVVERARAMGFEPSCALELEFYVLREDSASVAVKRAADLVPLGGRPSTYGVVKGGELEPLGRRIREQMLAFGLPIEACSPETGPGQFEINLRYGPALEAADQAVLFKTGVKELARAEGLLATFMAKPHTDWAGSSCHVHVSLRDAEGRGAFHDPAAPHGISRTMRHFIGGCLATMAELSAVLAPTPNAYRRFGPYSWAGTTATWGIDNRSTGIRAVLEGEHGTRVEHRRAGADVNPYLGAAAVIAAGLHGIEHELEPADAIGDDVYALPAGAVPRLPASLGEATELLAASEVVPRLLGADFTSHLVAMQRAEVATQALAVTDWEIARYLEAL